MVSATGLSVNDRAAFIGYIFGRNIQLKAEKFPCRADYRESVGVFFFFLTFWSWQLIFNVIHHHESLGKALLQYSLAY